MKRIILHKIQQSLIIAVQLTTASKQPSFITQSLKADVKLKHKVVKTSQFDNSLKHSKDFKSQVNFA